MQLPVLVLVHLVCLPCLPGENINAFQSMCIQTPYCAAGPACAMTWGKHICAFFVVNFCRQEALLQFILSLAAGRETDVFEHAGLMRTRLSSSICSLCGTCFDCSYTGLILLELCIYGRPSLCYHVVL